MKKAVVFDFDGTLTSESQNIWKLLWERCGDKDDENSLRKKLYKMHRIDKSISRKEWFELTAKAFKENGLTVKDLAQLNKQIKLINGAEEVIKFLYDNHYDLFIVSGCLKETILNVLGPLTKYFCDIESNMCLFDNKGNLKTFIPTKYDFEGKAEYIEGLKKWNYEDIVFIGNSLNDEWVHQTGCKTVCINPVEADIFNGNKWDKVLINVTDLRQIFISVNYKRPAKLAEGMEK